MRFYRLIILIVFSLLLSEIGKSQEIYGIISSSFDGEPIAGATVIIKGTNSGVITDSKGKYQIQVDSLTQIISISFIGHVVKDIEILNRENINVTLEFEPNRLEKLSIIENSKDNIEEGDIFRIVKTHNSPKADTLLYRSNVKDITEYYAEDSIKVYNMRELIPKMDSLRTNYIVDFFPDRTILPCFYNYISKSVQYPKRAKENGVVGVVYVSFTISLNGNPKDIKIQKGVNSLLDDEVVKIISNLPLWLKLGLRDINPKRKGQMIETKYIFPILFNLEKMN